MGLNDKILERRHDEVLEGFDKIAAAMVQSPKEDPELKKLLSENKEAINNFVKATEELFTQKNPDINVETNQDKVVEAINDLGKIMKGIDDRLTKLENKEDRPVAKKLKMQRGYDKELEYVIIEYK